MKKWFFILVLILFFGLAVWFFPNPLGIYLKSFLTNSKVYDSCEDALLKSNQLYVFCDKDGNIVSEPYSVSNGDFISFQFNLQKADIPYRVYVVCSYSDIPLMKVAPPEIYLENTITVSENFSCAGHFSRDEYHHIAYSGYVYGQPSNYTFIKIYIFDGRYFTPYMSVEEYMSRLDEAIIVYEKYLVLE